METTLTFEIVDLQPHVQASSYSLVFEREIFPERHGWIAKVDLFADGEDAGMIMVDKMEREERWHVSADFSPSSSCPRFMNGHFSRCTIPVHPSEEIEAALDALVNAASETVL